MAESVWFKLAMVAFLLVAAFFAAKNIYSAGYQAGFTTVDAQWEAERSDLNARNQALTASVAAKEVQLYVQGIDFDRVSKHEKQAIIDDYEQRMAGVRARTERVYIPVKMPAACNSPHTPTARAPAGDDFARAELHEKTVDDLASIAKDADTCIVERNELIKRYNAARLALMELAQQSKSDSSKKNPKAKDASK